MKCFNDQETKTFIRIGTWEENGDICVGFEVGIGFSELESQRVELSREETRELLALEEECSR
jgi:hypothetical protein